MLVIFQGVVLVVEDGTVPSRELTDLANDIHQQWIQYWETTTGHISSMTANPKVKVRNKIEVL